MKVGPFPRRNAESGTPRAPKPYRYSVSVRTLDGFELKEVDLIKINVEGMELEVLEGSTHTLMNWKPVVLFENKRSRYNDKLVDFFKEINYNIKVYKSNTVAYYE